MKLLFMINHIQYSPSGVRGFYYSPSEAGGFGGMHYGAQPFIFKKAGELRNKMTQSEKLLWNHLRTNEWVISSEDNIQYLCMWQTSIVIRRLIIEIDGSIHE